MLGYVIGAAALGSAVVAGYHTMAPASQWYGKTFVGEDRGSRRMALTYDDGPNDPYTGQLLEVLDKYQVKATFFLIGRFVDLRPGIAREVSQAGHVIGNHTYSHPNLVFRTRQQVKKELDDCRIALESAVGQHSNLFRPPFGGRRPVALRTVRQLGLEPILWNVTAFDWSATSDEPIVRNIRKRTRGGDVVLLHDGGHLAMGTDRSHTVKATERIIRQYKDEGWEFVTVPQMMER